LLCRSLCLASVVSGSQRALHSFPTRRSSDLERLLNHCAKQGIRLKNVRRRSLRAVAASATPQDFAALRTFAQERGWHIVQEKARSEEHTSELQSRFDLVCRLLLEKKK